MSSSFKITRSIAASWSTSGSPPIFLRYLQISAAEPAIIRVDEAFIQKHPELAITLGTRSIPVEPGWHFGSLHPGDPARTAVYDFVPDALLSQVKNLSDFLAILVFDKWVSNADGRQSVFFRARLEDWAGAAGKLGFVALMIDHGFAFNGPHWNFTDTPLMGLYPRRLVYESVRSLDDFQPWLDQMRAFSGGDFRLRLQAGAAGVDRRRRRRVRAAAGAVAGAPAAGSGA